MPLECEWVPPPPFPRLEPGEVHVWRASLRPSSRILAGLEATLSADETTRAARFHFRDHRALFVAARGIQRDILSRYLGNAAEAIRFQYSAYGKPQWGAPALCSGIHFNTSNSGLLALYALTVGRDVGVDLEELRPVPNLEALVEHCFSALEKETFRALPAAGRQIAFFRCWTRKEAYIKAVGEGFSIPLDHFDVAFTMEEPARLLGTRGCPEEAARWTLRELDPGDGYLGALAVKGKSVRLQLLDWLARK